MSSSDNNNTQPGLVAGHAEYVKGAAEQSTIGSATGSTAWQSSGEQAKAHAVGVMKQASEGRDPTQGYGKLEETAGKVTGCEGMQEEGAASKKPE
ncbi:hypothetical protein PG997_003007 [Apiospora hydei]|uniref:Uncharacterized protein n=1 Tax=Apiospora hydei TaxID=1337664 RepID=A0ABR1WY13_9PEZI